MEKILLVDDERDALEVLEWVLVDQGYEVRAVTQASNALEVCREFKPTLLMTDYFLRDDELTGLDLVRLLRQDNPRLRAVLMTGMMVEDLRSELEAVGNVEVVRKPFDGGRIVAQLQLLMAAE